jgi:epoxyqueuosine reductase
LLRNVAIALGNSKNPEAIGPLSRALHDPEPLVRGHAAWALGQFAEQEARKALQSHLNCETDEQVKAEVRITLEKNP